MNKENGKYIFIIGSFEKGGFQNGNLKNSKYIGRFKTKDKYLGLLFLFDLWIYNKKTFNIDVDLAFFDKFSDYIIGDVFFIEDKAIEDEVDKLRNSSFKENIIVQNIETSTSFLNNNKSSFIDGKKKINEELECFTYFRNSNNLEDEIKLAKNVVNEYTIDEKIKALEFMLQLEALKGQNTTSKFFEQLQFLKDQGEDLSKLIN